MGVEIENGKYATSTPPINAVIAILRESWSIAKKAIVIITKNINAKAIGSAKKLIKPLQASSTNPLATTVQAYF